MPKLTISATIQTDLAADVPVLADSNTTASDLMKLRQSCQKCVAVELDRSWSSVAVGKFVAVGTVRQTAVVVVEQIGRTTVVAEVEIAAVAVGMTIVGTR